MVFLSKRASKSTLVKDFISPVPCTHMRFQFRVVWISKLVEIVGSTSSTSVGV